MTIIVMTLTAFIISIIVVIIDSKFKIETKQDNSKIEELLPGLNCGGCGFGSCNGMACAIRENKENYKKCRPLRGEKLEKFEKEIDRYL